jgi:hypothetical protein
LLSVPYALHAKKAEIFTGTITETDPLYLTKFDITGSENGDLLKYNGTKYVKFTPNYLTSVDGSETKVSAGTNVTVTGAGTIASPYVVNSTGGGTGIHFLGEEYLGGIIFYLYEGTAGEQKGLIVSKTETTGTWSGSTLVGANRTEDGAFNSNLMPTGAGTARTWVGTLGAGWYLPSIDELSLLWQNRFHVNKAIREGSGTLLSSNWLYWSSTEYDATNAFGFGFGVANTPTNNKTLTFSVRGVRAF